MVNHSKGRRLKLGKNRQAIGLRYMDKMSIHRNPFRKVFGVATAQGHETSKDSDLGPASIRPQGEKRDGKKADYNGSKVSFKMKLYHPISCLIFMYSTLSLTQKQKR